jgi:hypothetical protein
MALPSERALTSNTDDYSNPTRRSLSPQRSAATPSAALCDALLKGETDTSLVRVFAQGMRELENGLLTHFPNNLYGDLDYFASAILGEARAQPYPIVHLERLFSLTAELLQLYGCHSPIHFQYAHDFLYGFDWARWVRKATSKRQAAGPFSMEFLLYLQKRGHELLALIAKDDAQYPRLATWQNRNAFTFSRLADDERLLHKTLAAEALVPVEAWRRDAQPRCDRDYSQLRAARARALHLGLPHG